MPLQQIDLPTIKSVEAEVPKPALKEQIKTETPQDKFTILKQKMDMDCKLVDNGTLDNSDPEVVITKQETDDIIKSQAPKAADYAKNYATRHYYLLGAERTQMQAQKELDEYAKLEKADDTDVIFEKWYTNEHQYDDKPPGKSANNLARVFWRLGGERKRAEKIALDKEYQQRLIDENQAKLAPLDKSLTYPLEEKTELLVHKETADASLKEAMDESNLPPTNLATLAERRIKIEADLEKAHDSSMEHLKHPAFAKEVGIKAAEEHKSGFRDIELEKLDVNVQQDINGQINLANQKIIEVKIALQNMTQSAEVAIIRGYVKEIADLVNEIKDLTVEMKQQLTEPLVDDVVGLSERLGMDESDIRLLFRRGQHGVITGVYQGCLGEVAEVLDRQIQDGVDLKGGQGIITATGMDNLNQPLAEELKTTLVDQATIAQAVNTDKKEITIGEGEKIDITRAKCLFAHFAKGGKLPDGIDLKIINKGGSQRVVLTQRVNDNITLTHVLSDAIEGVWGKASDGANFDNPDHAKQQKQGMRADWLRVNNLVITDNSTGQCFDVRSIISPNCDFRYLPETTTRGMSAEFGDYSETYNEKYVRYTDLSSPERLLALFHELGHNVTTAHLDPKLAQKGQKRWENLMGLVRSHSDLKSEISKEEYIKSKNFLVLNERGASARALFIVKELEKQGIKLGMTNQQMADYIETALISYESGIPQLYPECGRPFIRKDKISRTAKKDINL